MHYELIHLNEVHSKTRDNKRGIIMPSHQPLVESLIDRTVCPVRHQYHPRPHHGVEPPTKPAYPKDWVMKTALKKALLLREQVGPIDISKVEAIARNIAEMSSCADGLIVQPSIRCFERLLRLETLNMAHPSFMDVYATKIIPMLLEKLDMVLDGTLGKRFCNKLQYFLHAGHVRMVEQTLNALMKIECGPANADLLIYPGQLGRHYAGPSIHDVRTLLPGSNSGAMPQEFGLELIAICCELITQPDRMGYPDSVPDGERPLNIVVTGVETRGSKFGTYSGIPIFDCKTNIDLDIVVAAAQGEHLGCATGWIPVLRREKTSHAHHE